MELSPPDYVEKISRYLDSVERSKHNGDSNIPGGEDSDSGDSLFITQKVVPEAVRSKRLHHHKPEPTRQVKGGKSIKSKLKEERKKRRKRSSLFPRENRGCNITDLLNFTMGGFFKCVSELQQHHQEGKDFKLSLPTLDMQDITPLSEEEEEKSEDEDIKVVAKRYLVLPPKTTNQQSRFNQSKDKKTANKEGGRQTLHVKPATLKVIPIISDTESSDDGESSRNVLGHRPRTRATTRMLTRKAKRRLTQGDKEVLPLQNSPEEDPRSISDAVCEAPKLQRSLRLNTKKGNLTSTPVAPPAGDRLRISHSLPDIISDIGEKNHEEASQGLSDETYVEESLFEDYRADSLPAQTADELEVKVVDSPFDSNELREEEGHIPGGKRKKNKRKKKSAAENDGHEVDGNLESEVRSEDPVYSESCDVEDSSKKKRRAEDADQSLFSADFRPLNDEAEMKKKKKKKKRSAEDADQPQFSAGFRPLNDEAEIMTKKKSADNADQSQFSAVFEPLNYETEIKKKKRSAEDIEQPLFSAVFEPLNDEAEIKKKKKKKRKKEGIVITEECEEEEAASGTLDPPAVSTEQSEESGYHVENAAIAQETKSKRKKRKKEQKLSSHDANGDVSICFDDSVITDQCAGVSPQKKWETVSDGLETQDALEDQNTELVTKKKKKKDKKRSLSFLAADAEENPAHTHVEQSHHSPPDVCVAEKPDVSAADLEDCVMKQRKKRKRKMLMVQDGVEEDHELDFESNTEMERKCTGSKSKSPTTMERLESAADADVSDKKKKKKCKEGTGNVVEDVEASSETPGDQPLNYITDKKKKKKCKEVTDNNVEDAEASSEMPGDQPLNNIIDKKKKKKKCKEGTENVIEDVQASSETPGDQPLNNIIDKKKKKKKCKEGTENVIEDVEASSETPVDQPFSDIIDKKKKKKKCKEGTENVIEDVEASSETPGDQPLNNIIDKKKKQKKGKEGTGNEVEDAEAGIPGDQTLNNIIDKKTKKKKKKCKEETENMVEDAEAGIPGDQTLNDTSDDKKKKKIKSTDNVSVVSEPMTECAELEPRRKKKKHKKERSEQSAEPSITPSSPVTPKTSLSQSKMLPSGTAMKTNQKKIKRRLLNPCEDFLLEHELTDLMN